MQGGMEFGENFDNKGDDNLLYQIPHYVSIPHYELIFLFFQALDCLKNY